MQKAKVRREKTKNEKLKTENEGGNAMTNSKQAKRCPAAHRNRFFQ
jgi:hypothetical protein